MQSHFHIIFLFACVLLSAVEAEIKLEDIYSNELFVEFSSLAVNVTRRFMSSKTNTLVITEKCEVICGLEQKYHAALLSNILVGLYKDFAIQLFLGHYNDRPWDFNIFIVDSPEAFITLRYTFPSTQHERFFNFFILLTWGAHSPSERRKSLMKIFITCVSFSVRNVVVMTKSFDHNHISFYTYELFTEENCRERITIREINRYERGRLRNDFLFPDHISNFHGCYLNVTAHVIEPLLGFRGDIHNETHLLEGHQRLGGVEGAILRTIAKALNFKIRLRFTSELNTINMLENSTGCFRDLESNRASVALGGLSSTIANSSKFSSSYVHHTTPFVFVVRSGLCFGPIKQLLNPLCGSTWSFLLVFFAIFSLFTKIVQTNPSLCNLVFGPENKKPISGLFSIFFGNSLPANSLPKKFFARFLLAAWLLLAFEVRNGYQGKMFDSLRFSKRIPVPRKISHLLDQGYTLLSPAYSDFYPPNKTIIMRNVTQRLNMLQANDLRLTATVLLDSLAHYNFLNYNASSLTYVDEAIHTIPCVMYFRKHSIIRSSIDRKIKIFSDAGITSHFAKKHVRSWFQNMNLHSQYEIKLTNNNLKGVYFISSVMSLVSILVFICELLTSKSAKLRQAIDILNSF